MKRGIKITRKHKECMLAHHLKSSDWEILEEWDFYYKIRNQKSKQVTFIDKFRRLSK